MVPVVQQRVPARRERRLRKKLFVTSHPSAGTALLGPNVSDRLSYPRGEVEVALSAGTIMSRVNFNYN